MSLRARLFLLFGGLMAVLVVGEGLLVRALTRDLSAEVGEVAVTAGRDVISGLLHDRRLWIGEGEWTGAAAGAATLELEAGSDCPPPGELPGVRVSHRVVVERKPDGELVAEHHTERLAGDNVLGAKVERFRLPEAADEMGPEGPLWHVNRAPHGDEKIVAVAGGIEGTASDSFTYDLMVEGEQPLNTLVMVLRGPDDRRLIPIQADGVSKAVDRTSNWLMLGSLAILSLGLLVAGVVAHRVSAPLRGLAESAQRVGRGALGIQAPAAGGGEVAAAIGAFNRMSRQLRELDAAARELRAREHLGELGEVARGLAHTLRNPLNALGLSLEELAARSPSDPHTDALVTGARRQIKRIDASIRSFLALASEGAGEVEEIEMTSLVQDVALEAMQDGGGRASIDVDAAGTLPTVRGVGAELRAVVQALVVNAVEASPEGGRVRVKLAPGAGSGRVRIEVEDDGEGVPERIRDKLFTPHVTTKPTGSGMGLFLAKRIATTRYGGMVALESRDSGGTRAVLELESRHGPESRSTHPEHRTASGNGTPADV